jgi:biopolymer transport protein ExbB
MLQQITLFLDSGGPVLYGIFAVSIMLAVLIVDRYYFFKKESVNLCMLKVNAWVEIKSRNDHLAAHKWYSTKQKERLISEISAEFKKYRSTIHLLVIICPLMGLLGTVTGMISVFDVMAVTGTGNARAMASGISMATIPTMAGMVVSLVGLYFKTRFDGLSKKQFEAFKDKLVG